MKQVTNYVLFLLASSIVLTVAACNIGEGNKGVEVKSLQQTDDVIPELFQRKGHLATAAEWTKTQQKVAALKAKIAANPTDAKSRLQIATIYMAEARITGEHPYYYPAVHKILDGVIRIEPQNFEAIVLKASVNMSQHKFTEARAMAEKAQKLNPTNAYVYGVLVDANVELGNYAEAITASDKMQELKPSLEAYSRASYLREIHGDYAGAIEAMKLAVEAGLPGSEPQCWSRNVLADLYLKTNEISKAEEQYKINLAIRPSYAFSLAGMAKVAQHKKDYAAALLLLDSAAAILPEFSFHEQMADIFMLQGNSEKAMAKYKDVKSMLTEDEASGHSVALEMAMLHQKLNDVNTAEKYALQENAIRAKNIDVAKEMAWIAYKKNDAVQAKHYLAVARSTKSKDPELLLRAALIDKM